MMLAKPFILWWNLTEVENNIDTKTFNDEGNKQI